MLLNMQDKTIEGFKLHIKDPFRLKEIMYKFAMSTKPEHRIELGSKKEMREYFEISGTEFSIIANLKTTSTGRTSWAGGFYNEYSYTEHINEYDEYECPEIYRMLGILLNSEKNSEQIVLKTLESISKMYDYKKFVLKKIFDKYREELLSIIFLQRENSKYIKELNKLFQILYVDNSELSVFPEMEFMQKYKVYKYDLKNIKKV